jgi:flagellar motor switch protein FliN/FliY
MKITLDALVDALIAELGTVFGALAGADGAVEPGKIVRSRRWVVECALGGDLVGSCALTFDAAPVAALCNVIVGLDGEVPDTMVADTLRETMNQASAAVSLRPDAKGTTITVSKVDVHETDPAGPLIAAYTMTVSTLAAPIAVGAYGTTVASLPVHAAAGEETGGRIDVILDIDLPVIVRFGRTEMSIRALTRLGPGSVIDLGRSPDDPVEILVSDRVVAHGEVVVVGGNYGIRIIDVASPAERMRTVEAWT